MSTDQTAKSDHDNTNQHANNEPIYPDITGTDGESNRDEESIYSWNSQVSDNVQSQVQQLTKYQ
jgi:hypothetical protein